MFAKKIKDKETKKPPSLWCNWTMWTPDNKMQMEI